ncbi:hypothetical protein B9L19_13345 [Geobacillus thermocatenulatus]|uniref:Uncharacterized protein n=1 Tax=Geobacillus thermocatenulatus TaxID=33938 RepID=A0A226Q4P0_9BACL|nr:MULTISPECIES: hypothetical protein [Geobacillus]AST00131.1 hypothetical protein GT3921_14455 [Geobacillus thermocatenulatus]KLR72361.1 hypothetical protein ABH20_16750 [Geobacillus sp. T6]OXB86512.1 hypothetical protein B9L19_13345 [Geobacillus thermocatenulatus]RAN29956.1 hypothetical protein VC88_04800 [Geobacillus sp. A8]
MSNKGRQKKVNQETANPTVSKAEAEMAKDSVDTAKQAKKNRSQRQRGSPFLGTAPLFCRYSAGGHRPGRPLRRRLGRPAHRMKTAENHLQ